MAWIRIKKSKNHLCLSITLSLMVRGKRGMLMYQGLLLKIKGITMAKNKQLFLLLFSVSVFGFYCPAQCNDELLTKVMQRAKSSTDSENQNSDNSLSNSSLSLIFLIDNLVQSQSVVADKLVQERMGQLAQDLRDYVDHGSGYATE